MTPFDGSHNCFKFTFIVTLALACTVSEIGLQRDRTKTPRFSPIPPVSRID